MDPILLQVVRAATSDGSQLLTPNTSPFQISQGLGFQTTQGQKPWHLAHQVLVWGGPGRGCVYPTVSELGTHLPSDVACVECQGTVGLLIIPWSDSLSTRRGRGEAGRVMWNTCHLLSLPPGEGGSALGRMQFCTRFPPSPTVPH